MTLRCTYAVLTIVSVPMLIAPVESTTRSCVPGGVSHRELVLLVRGRGAIAELDQVRRRRSRVRDRPLELDVREGIAAARRHVDAERRALADRELQLADLAQLAESRRRCTSTRPSTPASRSAACRYRRVGAGASAHGPLPSRYATRNENIAALVGWWFIVSMTFVGCWPLWPPSSSPPSSPVAAVRHRVVAGRRLVATPTADQENGDHARSQPHRTTLHHWL